MATKTCEICQTRPAQTKAAALRDFGTDFPYCYPCHQLAEHENIHSDFGHEDGRDGNGEATDDCWVCHPELDQTREDYTARTGSSRAGMTITVPIRGTAKAKAEAVAARFPAVKSSVRTVKGITTLKVADLVLRWDAAGRFISGTAGERKVRNASEAIRLSAF